MRPCRDLLKSINATDPVYRSSPSLFAAGGYWARITQDDQDGALGVFGLRLIHKAGSLLLTETSFIGLATTLVLRGPLVRKITL